MLQSKLTLLNRFNNPLRKNDGLFMYGAVQENHPYIHCYCQETIEIVHGPSCIVSKEINEKACQEDLVSIHPRRGGGGTVVLSPGMIVVVVVGARDATNTPLDIFKSIHDGLISILEESAILGVVQAGISDLALNNKKILGSSLYLGSGKGNFYYQSVLMVNSNMNLLERYLFHPPKEPTYRQKRSHSDFCTTLWMEGYKISPDTLCKEIQSKLSDRIIFNINETTQ